MTVSRIGVASYFFERLESVRDIGVISVSIACRFSRQHLRLRNRDILTACPGHSFLAQSFGIAQNISTSSAFVNPKVLRSSSE